jgi:hypothetical protein
VPPVEKQTRTVAKAPDLNNATTGGAAISSSAMGGGANAEGRVAGMQQLSNPGPTTRNNTVEVTREYQQVRSLATQFNEQEEANSKMETLEMTAMVIKDTRFAKANQCNDERERRRNRRKNKNPTTATPETESSAAEDSVSHPLCRTMCHLALLRSKERVRQ